MTILISPEKLLLEEAHRRAEVALGQFRNAIRPIYRSGERGLPIHVGSCTLLRIDETKLIVTAAHIIDQHEKELWIGGEKALVPLTGMYSQTSAPKGERALDKFDFSASPVGRELESGLGNVTYIDLKFMSKGRRQDRSRAMYACIGYPNSQNKEMHATKREVNVRLWMHTSAGRSTHDKIGPWAEQTTAHLFIDFFKYATNADGSKRRSTDPTGASGGPVFYLGDFDDPETYRSDAIFQPMLEGILIERSRNGNALVAVKIAVIIHVLGMAKL